MQSELNTFLTGVVDVVVYLQAESSIQRTTAVVKTLGEFLTLTEESWISENYGDIETYSTLQGMPYLVVLLIAWKRFISFICFLEC